MVGNTIDSFIDAVLKNPSLLILVRKAASRTEIIEIAKTNGFQIDEKKADQVKLFFQSFWLAGFERTIQESYHENVSSYCLSPFDT